MKQGGIYEIVHTATGRRYIGSAVSFERRFRRHKNDLKRGRHHCRRLQAAWNKYGEAAFAIQPVMLCFSPDDLIPWEQRYIDEFKPEYNGSLSAGSWLGGKHTPESRAKIAAARTGCATHDAESRARIGAAARARMTGSKLSPAHCAAISAALKGRQIPPGTLAALRGRVVSAETRAKQSAAQYRRFART